MGFDVKLYTYAKKNNSTSRPSTPDGTYSCILKDSCSILNPIIALDLGTTYSPSTHNYAYIPTFNRYYYIKEWTFENALWYAHLEVDSLASWKEYIGGSTCYVLRSSVTSNPRIIDTTYPATTQTIMETSTGLTPWITDSISNGMFVVGVAGQSTTYYLFTQGELDVFFEYLFSDLYAAELTNDWVNLFPQLKAQSNPLQYITSIKWIPFITSGTQVETIRVGWVDVPCSAMRVDGSGLRYGETVWSTRKHLQSVQRGLYLNNAPYSNYTLFYPPWGKVPLEADLIANVNTITALWGVDLRTGQGTLTVTAGDSTQVILSWLHTMVAIDYQVSQIVSKGYGIGNMIAPMVSIGTSVASGNVGGAIANAVSEIGNAASSKIPSATTIGSSGGLDSLRGFPTLQYEWKIIVDEDNNHRGRPLCANRQISDLGGFIMVADADINVPCTQQEQNAIKNFMEGGFFYE